jgi:hypothetical protein
MSVEPAARNSGKISCNLVDVDRQSMAAWRISSPRCGTTFQDVAFAGSGPDNTVCTCTVGQNMGGGTEPLSARVYVLYVLVDMQKIFHMRAEG